MTCSMICYVVGNQDMAPVPVKPAYPCVFKVSSSGRPKRQDVTWLSLIDEYDKPMLQVIGNEELMTDYRNTLKAFYGVMKSCDKYIKFALLTGVTKFCKVSVFSDLNNLMDISMNNRFASLCGITEEELYRDFKEDIIELGEKNGMTEKETKATLKEMYDGYHFTEKVKTSTTPSVC